jgi:hypothetical protein
MSPLEIYSDLKTLQDKTKTNPKIISSSLTEEKTGFNSNKSSNIRKYKDSYNYSSKS